MKGPGNGCRHPFPTGGQMFRDSPDIGTRFVCPACHDEFVAAWSSIPHDEPGSRQWQLTKSGSGRWRADGA